MATYFGEVLPVISRAVDDEENDFIVEERKQGDVIIRWSRLLENQIQKSAKQQINCNLLIVAISPYVCAFVRDHFLPADAAPVGAISCGLDNKTKNSLSQVEETDNSCFIHQMNCESMALTVLWQHSAQSEAMFKAVDKLLRSFRSDLVKVVILCTSNISDYTSADGEDSGQPFVRSLTTDANKEAAIFPSLEVPNSLTGFPAYVLTYCQVHDIPADLYVAYHDLMDKPSNFDAFRDVLISYNLPHYTKNHWKKSTNTFKSTQNSCYI